MKNERRGKLGLSVRTLRTLLGRIGGRRVGAEAEISQLVCSSELEQEPLCDGGSERCQPPRES